ncbi:hypothetical protein D4S03_10520 [bacterium]|nr:MAG: hypothetical protein D4S03_10520 [bacterium]
MDKNWFEASLQKAQDMFKAAGSFLKGIGIDIWMAFYPLLKSEAALFVAEFKADAIAVAIQAFKAGGSPMDKVQFFGVEMAKIFLAKGKTAVADHLLNLLREVVVAELKAKNII